jgi:hypothetical protein
MCHPPKPPVIYQSRNSVRETRVGALKAALWTGAAGGAYKPARSSRKDPMLGRSELDPQEALVCTMVLTAAAESGGITDQEIGVMATLVQTLPVFAGFSSDRLQHAANAAVRLLREEEGLAIAGRLIRDSLPSRLRETAYTLACEVVAAGDAHGQAILRMLEFLGGELRLDALVMAAIERGTRARYQRPE